MLNPWMHYIMLDDHNTFILNRAIQDNIVIAHVVFHYLKTINSCLYAMALKLDIYKAYDQIN